MTPVYLAILATHGTGGTAIAYNSENGQKRD